VIIGKILLCEGVDKLAESFLIAAGISWIGGETLGSLALEVMVAAVASGPSEDAIHRGHIS
jgi:hypothetical protein